jgi:hypothetical protein
MGFFISECSISMPLHQYYIRKNGKRKKHKKDFSYKQEEQAPYQSLLLDFLKASYSLYENGLPLK